MLIIKVPGDDWFDETIDEFVEIGATHLELEHSLASLARWESKWKKPFLGSADKTDEETLDYIRCMVQSDSDPSQALPRLTVENVQAINAYIEDSMTATWFSDQGGGKTDGTAITAEIIYYWMVSLTIPFECEHWHLRRLLALIRVCNEKNKPPKKMSRREAAAQQRNLNAARQAGRPNAG